MCLQLSIEKPDCHLGHCDKAQYLLTDFFYTKGYIRYFECLQEEKSHFRHLSILRVIGKSLHDQQICVPEVSIHRGIRIWFKTRGILGTKEYFSY